MSLAWACEGFFFAAHMPFEYSIDPDRNLLRETVTGTVTTAELRAFASKQVRD